MTELHVENKVHIAVTKESKNIDENFWKLLEEANFCGVIDQITEVRKQFSYGIVLDIGFDGRFWFKKDELRLFTY